MARSRDVTSLVADVGGTNTRIARARRGAVLADSIRRYRNADHGDLTSLFVHYLAATGGVACDEACIAVAGLVREGVADLTNVDWHIDVTGIARATGARAVALLNDLEAKGHAVGHVPTSHLRRIMPQTGSGGRAVQLVIGIGTGFNVAVVHHLASGRHVAPAEAGHVSMPVGNDADLRLARFIEARNGFADVEEVLSGRGIETIHAWLGNPSPGARAADIVHALARADPRAEAALRVFVRLLAVSIGNLALTTLPFGGIYLAGSVSRAIAPHLEDLGFVEAFRDKGRFSDFMKEFAVSVIEDEHAALTGCARHLATRS